MEQTDLERWLAAAARTMASAPTCWLVLCSSGGDFSARPMGPLPAEVDDVPWILRFITDGRSRKAARLRRGEPVVVLFQNDANEAYVKASGRARLRAANEDIAALWRSAYGAYFPTDEDRANAAFIEFEVESLELWIRGVTPEPSGLAPTCLERHSSTGWRTKSG